MIATVSIQVLVQKNEDTLVQAQGFPDTVTDQISTVEYRDFGLISGQEISVDVYQDLVVAFVGDCVVRPVNHYMYSKSNMLSGTFCSLPSSRLRTYTLNGGMQSKPRTLAKTLSEDLANA